MLALTRPTHGVGHRLVEINNETVNLVSAVTYNSFDYDYFFKVNVLTHVIGDSISFEDALSIIESNYQPDWYKDNGKEYTDSTITIMKNTQSGKLREIDFLKKVMEESKIVN